MKYENPSTYMYQSKFMSKVKVFEVAFKGQRVKVMVRNERSSHKKYTSHCTYQSKVMSEVKVFEKIKLQGQRHGMK
jgi:hypothetical protein